MESINYDDPKIFKMIQKRHTDGIFQIESNLFKGLIGDIVPDKFSDIVAITSIGRPGPLSANMHSMYADRKHGFKEATEPVKNTWDIVGDSFGTIIYQESIMKIAQRVANFDDNQVDSFLRKSIAKKKKALMDLCKQWFAYGKVNEAPPEGYDETNIHQPYYDPEGKYGKAIPGGANNNYNPLKLIEFFESLEGYSEYLFNKSHACSYSLLTLATAYLKCYHPAEFISAVLSIQATDNESINQYVKVARNQLKLKVTCPHINKSGRYFTPNAKEKEIIYGLSSVKGLGAAKLDVILENQPYDSLEDATERLPKNIFNKTVGENLIKAGAFDFENPNRYEMLNKFYDLRKIKNDRMDPAKFTEQTYIDMETEIIGSPITFQPWWDMIQPGTKLKNETMKIVSVNERKDKNGRLMAFAMMECENSNFEAIIFSSKYGKINHLFHPGSYVSVSGKKDEKEKLILDTAKETENSIKRSKVKILDIL